jgi:hypothetical protein
MPLVRTAPYAEKAMNAAASPAASVTAPYSTALAASRSRRSGIAASVARIIPEEYSIRLIREVAETWT